MIKQAQRLRDVYTTIDRYPQLFARTEGTINLGPGEPATALPPHVTAALVRAVADGHTGYSNVGGTAPLKVAVREYFQKLHGLVYSDSEVIVGIGAKQILANALLATVDPGDEAG